MSIRRSIAAAVFVAAVSAPTVLGATQAVAETAPTGQSQPEAGTPEAGTPDQAAPDQPAPAASEPAETAPATGDQSATAAPESAGTIPAAPVAVVPAADEQAVRERLAALAAERWHTPYFFERVNAALAGDIEDARHFLDTELPTVLHDDKLIRVTNVMSVAGEHSPLRKAAGAVLDAGTDEAADHFLEVVWPAAAPGYRSDVAAILAEPGLGRRLSDAATAALAGDDLDLLNFLFALPRLRLDDDLLRASQAMSSGGPEVRRAAGAALDAGTPEALRAFMATGLAAARAKDEAAAQQQNQGSGTTVTPAADTTTTTAATTTTTAATTTATVRTGTTAATVADQLASTGAEAPLGALTVGGATALALGVGTLVVTRRRQES